MGVPGFLSWLRRKYPQIVDDSAEDTGNYEEDAGDKACDNLYIGTGAANSPLGSLYHLHTLQALPDSGGKLVL